LKRCFVRTIEAEPQIEIFENEKIDDIKELFNNLPTDETIINRFPFNDPLRASVEIYRIGTEAECQNYIDKINFRIRRYFKTEEFIKGDFSNPLISKAIIPTIQQR